MAKFEESIDDAERLTFYPNGTALVIRFSPHSRKFHKAILPITETNYIDWQIKHKLIQDAFPNLSNEEREFLMTGYTPEEWNEIFPPEKE